MAQYCGSWCFVGQTPDGGRVAVPIRCHSWNCPTCRISNKYKLLARLRDVQASRFLTLTCNPHAYESPDEAFRALSLAFSTLLKRIKRHIAPKPVEYFMVWERTKAGWPHIHCLVRGPYITQRWLSAAWSELAKSPIVDIRRVKDSNAAVGYLAKYLAKSPQCPDGMKRYRMSKGFLTEAEKKPLKEMFGFTMVWMVPQPIAEYRQDLEHAAWACHTTEEGYLIAKPPWMNVGAIARAHGIGTDGRALQSPTP